MRECHGVIVAVAAIGLCASSTSAGCGSDQTASGNAGASTDVSGTDPAEPGTHGGFGRSIDVDGGNLGEGGATGCTGLQCQQHDCSGGEPTTVHGVVYDPAGKNPLYNVVVYVPNAPVAPFTQGATCDS